MTDPTPELIGRLVTLRLLPGTHLGGEPDEGLNAALRRIHDHPDVARWWDAPEPDFPVGDDPDGVRYVILVDGEPAGLIQYSEDDTPKYRHAGIDVFLDPAVHGRGNGLDAVLTLATHLVLDRRHHRLTIDPAAANAPAIACYTAAGFRPVGTLRLYERDADGAAWHDGLLMDALAEEILAAARTRGLPRVSGDPLPVTG
jgi:aminoglycoside 6'-N-acetyltransferase